MDWVLYFTIYAVIGYIVEVVGCSVSQKRVVNRGFLFGPVVPIYGFGALIILIANSLLISPLIASGFNPVALGSTDLNSATSSITIDTLFSGSTPVALASVFLISLIACSLLEYFTSFALEKLFHIRWWDYSTKTKLNLNGRICLKNSLLFGLGGIVIIFWVHPLVSRAVLWLDPAVRLTLAIIALVLFALDTFVSTAAVKRAVKVTDFGKIVGDQTNEIKRQCSRMLGQFIQIWRGADPRVLAKKARDEFEKRQKLLADRFYANMKRREERFAEKMYLREARFKNLKKKGK